MGEANHYLNSKNPRTSRSAPKNDFQEYISELKLLDFCSRFEVFYQDSPISSDMELKLSSSMQWICSSEDNGPCNTAVYDRINVTIMIGILTAFGILF